MKTQEIRELMTEDLHLRLAELREELFNLRFQLATGQLDNHRRLRQVKREVAQIRTVLRERDFAAVETGQPSVSKAVTTAEPAAAEPAPEPDTPAESTAEHAAAPQQETLDG